jgi:hypothetical protein
MTTTNVKILKGAPEEGKIEVRILSGVVADGQPRKPGDIVSIGRMDGLFLCSIGAAELHSTPPKFYSR